MAVLAALINPHSDVVEWHTFDERLGHVAAATQRMLFQPSDQWDALERFRCGVQ